jgi:hypothetical protein
MLDINGKHFEEAVLSSGLYTVLGTVLASERVQGRGKVA